MSPVKELLAPTDARPQTAPDDIDALIEEARRRARRRRLAYATLVLALAAGAAAVATHRGGGGGRAGRGADGRGAGRPATHATELQQIERAAAHAPIVEAGLLGPRTGWAMNGLAAWLTFDGGAHWRTITPPHVSSMGDAVARVIQIEFADARHGWISATDVRGETGSLRHGEIDRTMDGGRTWETVTSLSCALCAGAQLSFLDAHRGFALAGSYHRLRLYETADGGVTWTRVATPPFSGGAIVFLNEDDGFGAMRNLYRTTDGGTRWRRVDLPVPARYARKRMTVDLPTFFGARDGVSSARVLDPSTKAQHVVVYVTHDGGATWSARPAPAAADPRAYTFGFSGGTPFSAATATDWKLFVGDTLYTTADAGAHWARIHVADAPKPPAVWDVAFTSPSRGWAIFGVKTGAALVQTSDGGRSWTPVPPPAMRVPSVLPARPACGSACRRA